MNRGVSEQKLDLFELAAAAAAEFCAGTAEIVCTEILDPQLGRRVRDHTPHCQVTQT